MTAPVRRSRPSGCTDRRVVSARGCLDVAPEFPRSPRTSLPTAHASANAAVVAEPAREDGNAFEPKSLRQIENGLLIGLDDVRARLPRAAPARKPSHHGRRTPADARAMPPPRSRDARDLPTRARPQGAALSPVAGDQHMHTHGSSICRSPARSPANQASLQHLPRLDLVGVRPADPCSARRCACTHSHRRASSWRSCSGCRRA